MASYNEAILMGNLTADPELKYTTGGTSLCNFNLAVNNKMKDREEVLFMPCVVFGKLSEVVIKYCSKGKNILVNGRLVEERWENDEGQKRSKIKLYVNQLRLLGSPNTADTPEPKEEF
jgi:single-strand DNA-binding protein